MTRDQAWKQIVASPLVDLSRPINRLCSADFKALGQEPRLMTKFDARGARPEALRENGLFLLPETNGSYLLLREDGYCDLPAVKSENIEEFEARFPFPLVSLRDATSEMSQLDRLFQCRLIERIIGTNEIYATIRGRRFAPHFDYRVGDLGEFSARGIQYEVDQGYETRDEIILFEAKNTTPQDFLIRQIYFPYRVYLDRFCKRVRLFFFNYNATSGVNSFHEYRFADPQQYRSIEVCSSQHFRVRFPADAPRTLGEWLVIVPAIATNGNWEVPQADDFAKVIDFPLQVAAGYDDAGLIAGAFDFTPRQSSYYRRAAEQMGLVNGYALTDLGRSVTELSPREREEKMIAVLLAQPVIRHAIEVALRGAGTISKAGVAASIDKYSALGENTIGRRTSSVISWLRWLETTLGELRVGERVLQLE